MMDKGRGWDREKTGGGRGERRKGVRVNDVRVIHMCDLTAINLTSIGRVERVRGLTKVWVIKVVMRSDQFYFCC